MTTPAEDRARKVAEIRARWEAVRGRVAAAARRSGRPAEEVRIVAVSKGHAPETIAAAVEAGIAEIGENYVQELGEKQESLGSVRKGIRWHFVGRLQSNKARALARLDLDLLHSLDAADVARELDHRLDRPLEALVQVNIAGEATKAGVSPTDLWPFLASIRSLERVKAVGLMTIPPPARDAEKVRPYFRALRALRDQLRPEFPHLRDLSMGTSHDFEAAVEEGATLVRIGTAILGERPQKRWRGGGDP